MSNKKQSSVEQMWEELDNLIPFKDNATAQKFSDILDKYKEMHKEEMDKVAGDWWNEGASYMHDGGRKYKNFEQYYNETFGSNNE